LAQVCKFSNFPATLNLIDDPDSLMEKIKAAESNWIDNYAGQNLDQFAEWAFN